MAEQQKKTELNFNKHRRRLPKEKLTEPTALSMLTVLAFDNKHGRILADMLTDKVFPGDLADIALVCLEYWTKYKRAPGEHLADAMGERMGSERLAVASQAMAAQQRAHKAGEINARYVLDSAAAFKRRQKLKGLVFDALHDLFERSDVPVADVEAKLAKHLRELPDDAPPSLQATDVRKVFERLQQREREFYSGVQVLDDAHVAPSRGRVQIFVAPTNLGKSWYLIHIAKHALLQHHKVLHVTLEMSPEEVIERYWQTFFGVPTRGGDYSVTVFERDASGKLIGFAKETRSPSWSLSADGAEQEIQKRLKPVRYNISALRYLGSKQLRIEAWPPGAMTAAMLRAKLGSLEMLYGFKPDLIVVDYIGNMKMRAEQGGRDQQWQQLQSHLTGLAGLAKELDCAVVTAQQANREGAKAGKVRATHIAGAWALTADTDMLITYSQDEDTEQPHGIARLFVAKNRQGEGKFWFGITQNYRTGQFCLDSTRYASDKVWEDMVASLGDGEIERQPDYTPDQLSEIKRKLDDGKWRSSDKAENWAGTVIADVLSISLSYATGRKRCKQVLDDLIEIGELVTYKASDKYRIEKEYVKPAQAMIVPDASE